MKAIKSLLLISFIAQINIQAQPVRPGDFNMDGVVNVSDVLFWGLAHGNTGPVRNNATTDWTPQPADDWSESVSLVNNKYQDGDGNGLIDTFDLDVFYLNYDETHNNTISPIIESQHEIEIHYDYRSHGADKMHTYLINTKADTLCGVSFTFDYSEFANVAMIQLDITDSWIETEGVAVQVSETDNALLHVALTRTDRTNVEFFDETIAKIVVCEPIASLTDSPKVHVKNGEIIRADEKRYTIEDRTYTTPDPGPKCIELWNGEKCQYENGTINHKEALLDDYGNGFCFEGELYGDNTAAISMGCGNLSEVYNVCDLDTLRFYAKSDIDGIGKSFEFYISDTHGNLGYAIPINNLDTTYQRIVVPINTLSDKSCSLEDIEWVNFRKTQGAEDFRIYIEDIKADWARVWKPDLCYYQDAILNEEEAYNGRYCYERVVDKDNDSWYHSALSLWCEDAPYDFSVSDEVQFYAKADKEGKTFNVYLSESGGWERCYNEINVNDYIEGGSLTTNYRLVSIPIDSLKTEDCALITVDHIHFFNYDDSDFKFYIDDIHIYSYSDSCESLPLVVSTDTPEILNPTLTLYPNPVSESILNIEINNLQTSIAEMLITDLQGRTLDQSRTSLTGKNTLSYNTDNLPTGMYIIQIKDEDGQAATSKFVKIK